MPSMPMLLSASFTSSSLKGWMIASIFFMYLLPRYEWELRRRCQSVHIPGQIQRLKRFFLGAMQGADSVVQLGILELREKMPPVEAHRRFQRVHRFVDVVVDGVRHSQAGAKVH